MKILLTNHLLVNSFKVKYELKIIRQLCLSHTNGYQNRPNYVSKPSGERFGHPFGKLFEWHSLHAFARHLIDNMVYFDGHLLAISKPWGVGLHKPLVNITDRNSHLSDVLYSGSPKYCIKDALEVMSQMLDIRRLLFVKSIHRFMSGIVLLATDESTEQKVTKALRRSAALEAPAMSFWCVTKGYPIIDGTHSRERVGIKLLELDEFGDYKQPIIIGAEQLTNTMRRRHKPMNDGLYVKPALVELKTIDRNTTLGVALVELKTNVMKWDFIQCYLAQKTAFVLGDSRFSRQVKHIMGTPLSVKPDKMNFSQDVEPLPTNLCKRLAVKGNSHIPVLIHVKRLVLPSYSSKKEKKDLVIETNRFPDYFDWSLKQLDLRSDQ